MFNELLIFKLHCIQGPNYEIKILILNVALNKNDNNNYYLQISASILFQNIIIQDHLNFMKY